MDHDEQPHQELVKCVLVGDNAVGKTRLTCARAARKRCSMSQLMNPHVPTVWAIDQYRIYKEVLKNSCTVLDGVNVSLRLWDTFGDHHKDRRFAYSRSDVVLMCFDISRLKSLKNCREMWHGQVKKFCPNVPVILVGCKNDIRFVYRDVEYLNYCKERSPLIRQVREQDLVMPDQARAVAKELGLPYYETSTLTYFGVDEVFENAIRAALCARRQQRFWMTNLRKVLKPKIQEPFCPPKPKLPEARVLESSLTDDHAKLVDLQILTDVIFVCDGVGFSSHRFLLCASSPLLLKILSSDSQDKQGDQMSVTRSISDASLLSNGFGGSNMLCPGGGDFFNDDTELLIHSDSSSPSRCGPLTDSLASPALQLPRFRNQHRRRSSHNLTNSTPILISGSGGTKYDFAEPPRIPPVFRNLNYPAFHSLKVEQVQSFDINGRVTTTEQTILTCSKLITARAMAQVIQFLYKGTIDFKLCNLTDLKQAAEFLDLPDMYHHVVNRMKNSKVKSEPDKGGRAAVIIMKPIQMRGLLEIALLDGLFSDVTVRLDDGPIAGHKALLMCRCDMMFAMFSHDDFREKVSSVVHFPGVRRLTFHQLLHYLYTDTCPPQLTTRNCVELIELANRLCLGRLLTLVEKNVIRQLTEASEEEGLDLSETVLSILEHCQMHNAEQLGDWCKNYLAQNYSNICRKYPKVLRSLQPENQAALNINQWPPVWYLKDYDQYQRLILDREREERPKVLKRTRNNSGCLCFSNSKGRRHS